MINCILSLYNYCKLSYKLYFLFNDLNESITIDDDRIVDIKQDLYKCGAVSMKFMQWSIPYFELRYDSQKNSKWISILKTLYENCPEHPIEYTSKIYKEETGKDLLSKYEIIKNLGSGSIGQTYLIKDKNNCDPKGKVLKVIHPNIHEQIYNFKLFFNFIGFIPIIKKELNKLSIDLLEFFKQFDEQSNFIKEGNNLLRFYNNYKEYDNIIIPELYYISKDLLIMSYEEGYNLDDLDINDYQRYNLVFLNYLFVRNNQLIENFYHGDIHDGNVKYRKNSNNGLELVIYDYGFCFELTDEQSKIDKDMINCLERINIDIPQLENLLERMCISTPHNSKGDRIKYVKEEFEKYTEKYDGKFHFDPKKLVQISMRYATYNNTKLYPELLRALICTIQVSKNYAHYNLTDIKNNINTDDIIIERYKDIISKCETMNKFHCLKEYYKKVLESKISSSTGLFTSTDYLDDSFKSLALKY